MTTQWKELGTELDLVLEISVKMKGLKTKKKQSKRREIMRESKQAGSSSSGSLAILGEANLSNVILEGKVAQELLLWKPWDLEIVSMHGREGDYQGTLSSINLKVYSKRFL